MCASVFTECDRLHVLQSYDCVICMCVCECECAVTCVCGTDEK